MVGSVKDVSSKDKPQDKIIKKKEDFKAVIRRDDGVLQKIGGVSGGGVYGGLDHSNAACFHAWTFIAGFTAAGETASPPMELGQGHSQTRISIIFFIPQKKKRLKEREREVGRGRFRVQQ